MAQKNCCALILLFCLLAHPSFAASQADIKKFPPVSGVISGQVPAGVISITINGQPVKTDSDQTFFFPLKLKAGEKYVILTINYKGLRIIKKYLITRKQAIEKFNVYVPPEKLAKPVEVAMPAEEVSPETETATSTTQPPTTTTLRIRRPMVITTTTRRPTTTTTTTTLPAALAAKMAATQKTLAPTLRDRFNNFLNIFAGSKKPVKIIIATTTTKKPTTTTTTTTIATTTTITTTTSTATTTTTTTTTATTTTTTTTTTITTTRPTTTTTQKPEIAPPLPSRAEVIAKIKAAPKKPLKKQKGYQYVWEFDKGKLLIVSEIRGRYYASIYLMATGEWLDFKALTSAELKELIEQPATDVKPKKK